MVHIDVLELMVILVALKAFSTNISQKVVVLKTDNMTAMYYIQRGEHTRPSCLTSLSTEDLELINSLSHPPSGRISPQGE